MPTIRWKRTSSSSNHATSDDRDVLFGEFLDMYGANTAQSNWFDLREFSHQRRVEKGTDWAFTMFVLDNSTTLTDLEHIDGGFANNGVIKTSTNFHERTVAHESAHVFYAPDEYPSTFNENATTNVYTFRSGYYNTQNLNAHDGHPNPGSRVPSIMNEMSFQAYAGHLVSDSAAAMMGWQDTDGDKVFDALDQPLTINVGSQLVGNSLQVTGTSSVTTLPNLNPHGSGNDVSINRIQRAEYRVGGGSWQTLQVFDSATVSINALIAYNAGDVVDVRTVAQHPGVVSPPVRLDVIEFDYGDAPAPYPTTLLQDGARHLATGPRLGAARDFEHDGIVSATAEGDDDDNIPDEDGVLFGAIAVNSTIAALNIELENASTAKVDAWIDFNGDGDWDDSGEQILSNVNVDHALQTLNFNVPAGITVGDTYARVRPQFCRWAIANGLCYRWRSRRLQKSLCCRR